MKPIIVLFISFIVSIYCHAHGGGTDENGGHYDRKTGDYHYHHGMKAHQHPGGVCELTLQNHAVSYSKNIKPKENGVFWKAVILGLLVFGAGYLAGRKKNQ